MSTYLLVWVIGVFDYLEASSKAGVKIRVYTPAGRKEDGKYALEIATQCLDFYSEYFGIPYPLQKLDLVSIHSKYFFKKIFSNACPSNGKLGMHQLR